MRLPRASRRNTLLTTIAALRTRFVNQPFGAGGRPQTLGEILTREIRSPNYTTLEIWVAFATSAEPVACSAQFANSYGAEALQSSTSVCRTE